MVLQGSGIPVGSGSVTNAEIKITAKVKANDVHFLICNSAGSEPTTFSNCTQFFEIQQPAEDLAFLDYYINIPPATFSFLENHRSYAIWVYDPAPYDTGYIDLKSPQIRFTTDDGIFGSVNATTPTATQSATLNFTVGKLSCGVFQVLCDSVTDAIDRVANTIIGLFIPDVSGFNDQMAALHATLLTRAPFGYIVAAMGINLNPVTELTARTISVPFFPTTLAAQNHLPSSISFTPPDWLNTLAGLIKTVLTIAFGFFFVVYLVLKARDLLGI
jgi:hypothetical protein